MRVRRMRILRYRTMTRPLKHHTQHLYSVLIDIYAQHIDTRTRSFTPSMCSQCTCSQVARGCALRVAVLAERRVNLPLLLDVRDEIPVLGNQIVQPLYGFHHTVQARQCLVALDLQTLHHLLHPYRPSFMSSSISMRVNMALMISSSISSSWSLSSPFSSSVSAPSV